MLTKRFALQFFVPDDQGFVFEALSHPDVIRYYGVRFSTYEATKVQMDWLDTILKEASGQWWKIVDRQNGTRVGAIGMNHRQPLNRSTEIGYWLLPQYWKQGIIREVLPVVTRHLFHEYRFHRIAAIVEAENEASCRVLEHAGFTLEGIQRECEYKEGKFISLKWYSLLETEV